MTIYLSIYLSILSILSNLYILSYLSFLFNLSYLSYLSYISYLSYLFIYRIYLIYLIYLFIYFSFLSILSYPILSYPILSYPSIHPSISVYDEKQILHTHTWQTHMRISGKKKKKWDLFDSGQVIALTHRDRKVIRVSSCILVKHGKTMEHLTFSVVLFC